MASTSELSLRCRLPWPLGGDFMCDEGSSGSGLLAAASAATLMGELPDLASGRRSRSTSALLCIASAASKVLAQRSSITAQGNSWRRRCVQMATKICSVGCPWCLER